MPPPNEQWRIEENDDSVNAVFNDEQEFEDTRRYGITGNVSSPAITSRLSQNSSSPANTENLSENVSSPDITNRHSSNSSSPSVTETQNEGEIPGRNLEEENEVEYTEENEYEIEYGEESEIVEEEVIGELVMGLTEDGNWVIQSIVTPQSEDRDEAQEFAQNVTEELEL